MPMTCPQPSSSRPPRRASGRSQSQPSFHARNGTRHLPSRQAGGILRDCPGWIRSGFLMVSRFASKIRRHSLAFPYSAFAILDRLSPFWTTYVLTAGVGAAGVGAVEELPLCTFEKSALGLSFLSSEPD